MSVVRVEAGTGDFDDALIERFRAANPGSTRPLTKSEQADSQNIHQKLKRYTREAIEPLDPTNKEKDTYHG